MRLMVTGAAGLLGQEVTAVAAARRHDVVALARAHLDITDAAAVATAIGRQAPEVVLHCAGYTAVDRAESEPDQALLVNRDGTAHVAAAAREAGSVVLYVSTDFVFDGAASHAGLALTLAPGSHAASGRIAYLDGPAAGQGAPGLLVFSASDDSTYTVGFSDEDGRYDLLVADGSWSIELEDDDLGAAGAVGGAVDPTRFTVAGAPVRASRTCTRACPPRSANQPGSIASRECCT